MSFGDEFARLLTHHVAGPQIQVDFAKCPKVVVTRQGFQQCPNPSGEKEEGLCDECELIEARKAIQ